jgi:uncharacterized protein with GYD domain
LIFPPIDIISRLKIACFIVRTYWQVKLLEEKGGIDMTTYFMFGKYSFESLNQMSTERTDKAVSLIYKFGGQVNSMYTLLGEQDIVLIVDFPDLEQVMKASIALTKMTSISFKTSPAMAVEDFDKIITGRVHI